MIHSRLDLMTPKQLAGGRGTNNGLTCVQVAVVAFKKGQLKILSLAWDRDLGGRNFDEVLFDHFSQEFQERYKIDVRNNKKASFRLRLAIEKVC